MGNTTLVEHGIFTERADYRFHVCPTVKMVYLYKRSDVLDLLKKRRYFPATVWTYIHETKVCTAQGYLVPVSHIPNLRIFPIPTRLLQKYPITKDQTTSEKGRMAEEIVREMLRLGIIPLPHLFTAMPTTEQNIQGVDLLLSTIQTAQIKCDFDGGHSVLGGTGNLFIQTHECNPYGLF
ncbi:MAG: hypothetical protein QXQ53_05695 [Candidatus Methanosuratincola sp.]